MRLIELGCEHHDVCATTEQPLNELGYTGQCGASLRGDTTKKLCCEPVECVWALAILHRIAVSLAASVNCIKITECYPYERARLRPEVD